MKEHRMQPVSPDAASYDTMTIRLHWATAILVALQWVGAQVIDWFPSGWMRVDARSVHIAGGVALAAILAYRLLWRATGGRRLKLADVGLLNVVAKLTHWGLHALLTAMVLVGLFLVWARGDSIFNLFRVPQYIPGDRALADNVLELHATISWAILALAGLHASAALVHRYLWRDGVLARMLPGA
jgi:cytochrome b561